MPVNETLATYSDYAFHSSVAIYLLALVLHLGEYARTRMPAGRAASVPAEMARVGAAGGGESGSLISGDQQPTGRPWPVRLGRMGVALTLLGALVHIVSVVVRGLAVARWPWGNMYEFISAVCLMAVLTWLFVLRRNPGLRPLGAFVLLPVEVLLFLAGSALYVQAAPVVPALQSYWLAIHVTAVSVASGLLLVAGVASVLYLVRRHGTADGVAVGFRDALPSADALDRAAYRITVFAFPLYTFAIIAGAIWAEAAWGRFWGWDPKETVAFVVWVVYACYLHARATAGWRTGGAAWINVLGTVAILFNLVTTGLHSYAGVG